MQKFSLWLVLVAMTAALGGFATDCNSDCDKNCTTKIFGRKVVDPVCRGRCLVEKEVACRTGVTSCDVWKVNPGTSGNFYAAVEAITAASRHTGQPQSAGACHNAVDLASGGASAAGFAYKVVSEGARAAVTLSRSSVVGFIVAEGVKHFSHCACTNARYQSGGGGGGQGGGQRLALDLNAYCKRQYGSFSSVVLRDRSTVNGWSCRGLRGEMLAMDLRQACMWQHNTSQVGYTNPNDAYTWYCQR